MNRRMAIDFIWYLLAYAATAAVCGLMWGADGFCGAVIGWSVALWVSIIEQTRALTAKARTLAEEVGR